MAKPTAGVGDTLCKTLVDLADAHNNHASKLATLLGDNIANGGKWSPADIASANAHVQALGGTLAANIQVVSALRSPEYAALIVLAQKAYAGYSEGALTLQRYVAKLPDASFVDPDMTAGLDGLKSGKDALFPALDQLAELNAAGAVDCSVPIF